MKNLGTMNDVCGNTVEYFYFNTMNEFAAYCKLHHWLNHSYTIKEVHDNKYLALHKRGE